MPWQGRLFLADQTISCCWHFSRVLEDEEEGIFEVREEDAIQFNSFQFEIYRVISHEGGDL